MVDKEQFKDGSCQVNSKALLTFWEQDSLQSLSHQDVFDKEGAAVYYEDIFDFSLDRKPSESSLEEF